MDGRFYGGLWSIWEKAEDDEADRNGMIDEITAILSHIPVSTMLVKPTSPRLIGEPGSPLRRKNGSGWKGYGAKYDPDGLFFGFTGGLKA